MNNSSRIIINIGRLLGLLGLLSTFPAVADWRMNLYRGVTPISQDIYNLHMTLLGICFAIVLIVYGLLIFIIIRYRHSKGVKPATFDSNRKLEWLWAVIPLIILIIMAIPATKVLLDMEDFADSDVTIKVTGSQWRWHYQYLDHGVEFYSNLSTPTAQLEGKSPKNPHYLLETDRRVILPVDKKVRFLVTSSDVIHSWWVPELGVKRDAIPGYVHESWARIEKPGVYRGQCAELCGVNHAYMPIVVEAVSNEEFLAWVQKNKISSKGSESDVTQELPKQSLETVMPAGEQYYLQYCAACHRPDGEGNPPLFPSLVTSSVAVGEPISRHIDIVLNGIEDSAMQAYKDVLTDQQIAAIITYERNAWGHHTNDLVTPEQIQSRRLISKEEPQ